MREGKGKKSDSYEIFLLRAHGRGESTSEILIFSWRVKGESVFRSARKVKNFCRQSKGKKETERRRSSTKIEKGETVQTNPNQSAR